MNRFVWILIFIILGVLALIFGYWLAIGFFAAPPPAEIAQQPPTVISQPTADKKIKLVSSEQLAGYWFDDEGRIYLMKANGEIIGVSSRVMGDINQVQPAAGGRRALVGFNHPFDPTFAIVDVNDRSWTPLPEGAIAAAWHPEDEDKLIYLDDSGLKLLNLKTGRSVLILKLSLVDMALDWPEKNRILLADRPTAITGGKVWTVNPDSKTINEAASGSGLMIQENDRWRLQFTGSINRQADRLLLIDKKNNTITADIESLFSGGTAITLPDKCLFDDFKIYCAFPKNIPPAITLPDDYLKRKFVSEDAFYLITVNSSNNEVRAELIHNPALAVDAVNLMKVANKLYFLNRRDNKLYSLDL